MFGSELGLLSVFIYHSPNNPVRLLVLFQFADEKMG